MDSANQKKSKIIKIKHLFIRAQILEAIFYFSVII